MGRTRPERQKPDPENQKNWLLRSYALSDVEEDVNVVACAKERPQDPTVRLASYVRDVLSWTKGDLDLDEVRTRWETDAKSEAWATATHAVSKMVEELAGKAFVAGRDDEARSYRSLASKLALDLSKHPLAPKIREERP